MSDALGIGDGTVDHRQTCKHDADCKSHGIETGQPNLQHTEDELRNILLIPRTAGRRSSVSQPGKHFGTSTLERARDAVNRRLALRPMEEGLELELPIIVGLLNRMASTPEILGEDILDAIIALLNGAEVVNIAALQAIRQQLSICIWMKSRTLTGKLVRHIDRGSPVFCTLVGSVTTGCAALLVLGLWTAVILVRGTIDPAPADQDSLVYMRLRNVAPLCMVAIFGAIASVATRMDDFSKRIAYHPMQLFLNGAFKPLLSVLFAVVIYSILLSKIVQIAGVSDMIADDTRNRFLLWVIGFLCGFSERFARDLISGVEKVVILPAPATEPAGVRKSE